MWEGSALGVTASSPVGWTTPATCFLFQLPPWTRCSHLTLRWIRCTWKQTILSTSTFSQWRLSTTRLVLTSWVFLFLFGWAFCWLVSQNCRVCAVLDNLVWNIYGLMGIFEYCHLCISGRNEIIEIRTEDKEQPSVWLHAHTDMHRCALAHTHTYTHTLTLTHSHSHTSTSVSVYKYISLSLLFSVFLLLTELDLFDHNCLF